MPNGYTDFFINNNNISCEDFIFESGEGIYHLRSTKKENLCFSVKFISKKIKDNLRDVDNLIQDYKCSDANQSLEANLDIDCQAHQIEELGQLLQNLSNLKNQNNGFYSNNYTTYSLTLLSESLEELVKFSHKNSQLITTAFNANSLMIQDITTIGAIGVIFGGLFTTSLYYREITTKFAPVFLLSTLSAIVISGVSKHLEYSNEANNRIDSLHHSFLFNERYLIKIDNNFMKYEMELE